jgi:hypothetical protein
VKNSGDLNAREIPAERHYGASHSIEAPTSWRRLPESRHAVAHLGAPVAQTVTCRDLGT